MSSSDYLHLAHLKIPLENIISATDNFDDNRATFETEFEKRYWAQLFWSGELIDIAARRFNKERDDQEQLFQMEIFMLSCLKHKNVASLVGFCDENDEKIIITKRDNKASLSQYLSDPMLLTWVRRLEICVGVAHALSYIFYDEPRDFSVIHRDIDSNTVLLNDHWEPKLGDFMRSIKIKASERHLSFNTDEVYNNRGYTDPTYIDTKSVNQKSDMYSFGIVMFELLCGKKAVTKDDQDDKYFASVAVARYREKKLNEIIDWDMWNQMDSQSFNLFAEIAYDCLNEERSQRPCIDQIVPRLEKVLELQLEHENATISRRIKDLAHLKIPLENILTATNNFADENVIETASFGNIYKGQLSWSGELITVNARRINKERKQAEQEFWMEISMLASLKHKNLVSIVGFCDEKDEMVIINKNESRGWLDTYLSDPMSLRWVRRLEICVGLAHALRYIHHDEPHDFSVIHRNIRSFAVQLSDDWEAKLSNFECSMKIGASQRHHSFHTEKLRYTNGYGDPAYIATNRMNHKTDMYSFGIVMLEVLCSRVSMIDSDINKYLAPLAITQYRAEKRFNELIDWDLWKQMDSQSFNLFVEIAYDCLNEERSQRPSIDQIVPRLEKVLELQREHENVRISSRINDLAYLKIPLESILTATNNFADDNVIERDSFGNIYKGKLSWSGELINVNARRINKERKQAEQEFWMEISMLASLKHKNLVSIVGFCDEKDEMVIINKNETRGWLDTYLSDPMSLTWVRRLKICVGLAHALTYMHHDEQRDFSVIHRDIRSYTVQLNDDWEPKLSNFQRSMKIEASQRNHSFHTETLEYVNGYGDPAYIETKRVNHKSDMYSFGIIMFEVLCGRMSIIDSNSNKYLAQLAITHYKEKRFNEIVDWDLWKQMDSQSFNLFVEVAYDCLNEERSQRPSIDEIVLRLEKVLELQLEHENGMMSLPSNAFAHLRVPLQNIISATNNFAQENVTCNGTFAKEYSGQLLWSGELIDITARRLNKERKEGEQQFWMEISLLSTLKHNNLVSLVGFCDENNEKIIINKRLIRGSLNNYLSDPLLLTWVRRLEICVGLAHALSYIHNDEPHDFSVIHRNIDSYTVQLDDDWVPKLSDFECSMKIKASQRHHSFHNATLWYTNGYGDPTYIKTNRVNHKADMYSFGIVMFEVLCGRESIIANDTNKYLAQEAILHYKEKKLDVLIDPNLWEQMDPVSFTMFSETAYDCLNDERSRRPNIDEIVRRLEKALEVQLAPEIWPIMSSPKDLSYLRVPLEKVVMATNNFAEENISSTSGFAQEYMGQLLSSGELINVTARRLNKEWKHGEQQFWMEIFMLSSLKHKNLVSIVGFCDESDEKIIIINRNETKGWLNDYLTDPKLLTWVRRLEISVSLAHALSYAHYDENRDFSVIHRNISSGTVVLNDDWEPKLSNFESSMMIKASQKNDSFHNDTLHYTYGYVDPTYLETQSVNQKSDMYSFGIVLFELLCGRKTISIDEQDNKYLDPVAIFHYQEKILNDVIDPDLWKQMDPQSFNIFAETAYDCLNKERSQRPNTNVIITRLEKALKLQLKRENVFMEHSRVSAEAGDTLSTHHKGKSLKHLKIGLSEIKLATEKFAEKYCIGFGGFGRVYKAQLEHFDSSNSSSIEGGDKCDLPKKRSTVAIKHIFNPKGKQGFGTEIETLTSCKHDNIISLLGFCDEGPDNMILIYEYATRGSLEDFIQSTDKVTNLTWVQRIKISLNIAHGLKYIHTNTDEDKQKIIHRDIKSANILLSESWEAKIADFGLSKIHPESQAASTIDASTIAGTNMYLDPEYEKSGKLNKKSDIYSFGVVLFEILTGTLAYDHIYTTINKKGIAPIARNRFESGTLMEIVDHKIKEEGDGQVLSLSKGSNNDSLDIFSRIAYRCLAETQAPRPAIDEVIQELRKVLQAEEKSQKENFKMSLEDINLATQNLSDDNLIGRGCFGNLYKGEVDQANGRTSIVAKRLDRALFGVGETRFFRELDIPLKYKHENVIGLVGYCDEEVEKIIVHEFASRGSLDEHLNDASLTWLLRLRICLDIASGLNFLHATDVNQEVLIHRDIKSSNILLFDDWKAKITGFGLSIICPLNQNIIDDVVGTIGYTDPLCSKTRFLTKESDVFSLGVVLCDILCGKLSSVKLDDEHLFLPFLAKNRFQAGKLEELVFEGIKEQIEPQSFITFARIAYQCLHHKRERRPTTGEVVLQLKKAFEIQEDYETWEPKLPRDYKEIIQMSKSPDDYSVKKKEEIYSNFSEGILLQQDKVLLSLDSSGERSKMVSATTFPYTNSDLYNSQSLPESRFGSVVEILDISYLNLDIKANTQFLSRNVDYGVFLVFKFCDLEDLSSKPMYVNLKYRKGRESLHAYFATKRDNDWMMIELNRYISNQHEDVACKFLLESFSPYYRGDDGIYIEGIEFRAIDKVKQESFGKLKNVQQGLKSNINMDLVQQLPINFEEIFKVYKTYGELFWLGEVNGKKLLMVSAKASLYKSSNANNFTSIPSSESRFQKVIELLPQRKFQIKCTIKSQMLSLDTEYVCYLVFKLSEKFQGLHCPVKVRDVLHQQNNEAGFFYFTTPSPLNIHDFTRIPKQREDGWMEIQVWKFNSTHEFKDDSLSILMNFTSVDGIMSGLIVRGLEFWPM